MDEILFVDLDADNLLDSVHSNLEYTDIITDSDVESCLELNKEKIDAEIESEDFI